MKNNYTTFFNLRFNIVYFSNLYYFYYGNMIMLIMQKTLQKNQKLELKTIYFNSNARFSFQRAANGRN